MIHEVRHSFNKPQRPVIGAPIPKETIREKAKNARDFMAWLRSHTLDLRP